MSKYDPLADYLAKQDVSQVRLSFAQLERILSFPLPPSKAYAAWWSNNPNNSVMTRVWVDAGWRTRDVDTVGEKVTFYRSAELPRTRSRNAPRASAATGASGSTLDLDALDPVARSVLGVLAKRSGRSLAEEALTVLNDALKA